MSQLHLNAIVTQALLDDEFQAAILNGPRRARLAAFDLTEQEREAVLAMPAHDLDGFIRQIDAYTSLNYRWPDTLTAKPPQFFHADGPYPIVG